VVVASWIVTAAPDRAAEVRERIGALPGARAAGETDPIVVSTECADDALGSVQAGLAGIPGVVTVAMVVAYRDDETGSAR
jgi:nitrate reductase NapAB chaperone NapD